MIHVRSLGFLGVFLDSLLGSKEKGCLISILRHYETFWKVVKERGLPFIYGDPLAGRFFVDYKVVSGKFGFDAMERGSGDA